MTRERITLDELLEKEENQKAVLRATIERDPDDQARVQITPYTANAGCLCHIALTLPKSEISELMTTEDTHFCCGKTLTVVEVQFANETVSSIFSQLISRNTPSGIAHSNMPGVIRSPGFNPSSAMSGYASDPLREIAQRSVRRFP